MKTKKLIRNVLGVLVIVFMSAVLCGAGCSNAADSPSSGGGSTSNSGSTSLNAIERQIAGGSIKDGKVMYSFFANKRGSTSGGSANIRNARAAGGVGFSWSADSSGTLTIVLDSGGSTPVFKFTVTNGTLGACTKNGGSTVTFAPPPPSSSAALNEWEQKLLGKWKAESKGETWVLENGRKGKLLWQNGYGDYVDTKPILLWSATSDMIMITAPAEESGRQFEGTIGYAYTIATDGKSFTATNIWARYEDTGETEYIDDITDQTYTHTLIE